MSFWACPPRCRLRRFHLDLLREHARRRHDERVRTLGRIRLADDRRHAGDVEQHEKHEGRGIVAVPYPALSTTWSSSDPSPLSTQLCICHGTPEESEVHIEDGSVPLYHLVWTGKWCGGPSAGGTTLVSGGLAALDGRCTGAFHRRESE